jgi:hypothetical protein
MKLQEDDTCIFVDIFFGDCEKKMDQKRITLVVLGLQLTTRRDFASMQLPLQLSSVGIKY